MNENRCVCCDVVIPEGYLVCPTCMRKGSDPRDIGGFVGAAYREHAKYEQALRERDKAIRERAYAEAERLKLLQRIKTSAACVAFPGGKIGQDEREGAEHRIALLIARHMLEAGAIQFTTDLEAHGKQLVTVIRGRASFLQPRTEKMDGSGETFLQNKL